MDTLVSEPDIGDAPPDDSAPARQGYVSFEMDGETYALQMQQVQEIIRVPELVRVPLGPPSLEGLANLRGRVLAVVSLRRCCGLAETPHAESTRVVVVEAGGATLGLVVDRVAAVISVDPAQVESGESVQSSIQSRLLAAVITGEDGRMTTVIDVEQLVAGEFSLLARQGGAAARSPVGATTGSQPEDDHAGDTLELVSFAVDGEEYALPIDRVKEIVQAPERITPVPNSPRKVLGVMDLRGGLLPVLSLRSVFDLPILDLEPRNRIVVITVEREGRTSLIGVVMDTVREVLRVPVDLVGALPHVVSGGGRRATVSSICRLADGARLVSVLSVEALIDGDVLAALDGPNDPGDSGAREGDETAMTDPAEDELFVVFRLLDEEYCVEVDAVQEIIRVPETLVHVPGTEGFVEGLVNLRGIVLPVLDLRTRLGLERTSRDERQRIVVLIVRGVRTGFVVDSVAEVARVARTDLERAPELSVEQSLIITRVANIPDEQRMLLVVDADALLVTSRGAQEAAQREGAAPGAPTATAA